MSAEEFILYRRQELALYFRNMWGKQWIAMARKQFGVAPVACYRLANTRFGRAGVEDTPSGYQVCRKWESWARQMGFVSPLDTWIARGLSEEQRRIFELARAKAVLHDKQDIKGTLSPLKRTITANPADVVSAALGK